jgi:DNA-binding SARP family transcriptional activator/predicted ATPase
MILRAGALPDAALHIKLLGPPAVHWQGQPLAIPRRHVRALLYYLAVQEHPVARDIICLLFWPDIPDNEAHRNLTRLLAHLRMALPEAGLLVAADGTLDLNHRRLWCDAAAYACAGPEALEEAARSYTGPFLAGFDLPGCPEYDGWVSIQRSAFERIHLENLAKLSTAAAGRKDFGLAIEHARRYLEIDPLAEEIHRRLIWFYAQAGQRSQALRQFELCVTILEQQLGTDPLPETRAVYQAVLANQLPTIFPARKEEVLPPDASGLQLQLPMIGRSSALQALLHARDQVRAGKNTVVLISGEPGIGKSRLLHDFIQQKPNDSLILLGSGQHGEESIAYHPIVDALRSNDSAISLQLPPYWLAEVARLLPELNSFYPGLPPPIKTRGNEARIRLFEALSQYFHALQSVAGSVVLCIDDLHWCDRTSISWLSYFSRQIALHRSRILVVCAYRSEDADRVQELRDNLGHLQMAKEIPLEALTEADVVELVEVLCGQLPGSAGFAQRLKESSGGNPFFLLEILNTLSIEGKIEGDLSRVEFPLTESARAAISRRLGSLNARCRQVLEAGAVLGSSFTLTAAASTAGRSEMDTASSLTSLVKRQLLKEGAAGYRFRHDLILRAALAEVSPMRIQLLHKRAARALERVQPEAAAILARHYENGGDLQRALIHHRRAALKAKELFAWQEALTHYIHMEHILNHLDAEHPESIDLQQRIDILKEQVRLNQLQGQLVDRDENLAELDRLMSGASNLHIAAQVLLIKAQYLHQDGYYREAVQQAENALGIHCNDDIRCRLLTQLGFSYQFIGQPQRSLSVLQQALQIADEARNTALRAEIMDRLGLTQRLLGNYQEALDCALESYHCYSMLDDHYRAAQCLIQIGFNYVNIGQFDEAATALQQILDLAQKAGVRSDQAHAYIALGGLNNCKGENAAALQCFNRAMECLQTTRARHLIATAQAGKGIACYHLGDYDQSRRWMEEAFTSAQAIDHRMRMCQVLIQMGLLDIAQRAPDAAHTHIQHGLALARECNSGEDIAAGLSALARLERISENCEEALRCAEEALEIARKLKLTSLEVWARVEATLIHLALGQHIQAESILEPALAHAVAVHQRWLGTEEVYLAHAGVLDATGKASSAFEQRQVAAGIVAGKASSILDVAVRQQFLKKYRL